MEEDDDEFFDALEDEENEERRRSMCMLKSHHNQINRSSSKLNKETIKEEMKDDIKEIDVVLKKEEEEKPPITPLPPSLPPRTVSKEPEDGIKKPPPSSSPSPPPLPPRNVMLSNDVNKNLKPQRMISMKEIMESREEGETITASTQEGVEEVNKYGDVVVDKNTIFDKDTGRAFKITDLDEMNSMVDTYTTFSSNSLFPSTQQEVKAARAKAEEEKHNDDDENLEEKVKGGISKISHFFSKGIGHKKNKSEDDREISEGSSETPKKDGSIPVFVNKKDVKELSNLKLVQEIAAHRDCIWSMQFSGDGKYLATAGQDLFVCVWQLQLKDVAYEKIERDTDYFEERRVLAPSPIRKYAGHRMHVVDLSWSKSHFLLSASTDKTVRLFHVSREGCLYMFQHPDIVTAVCFHPLDDKFFLSGGFDKKIRIWNIPESRVATWAQAPAPITSATFSPDGQLVVAGLFNGECYFYHSERLKYHTQVDCKNRHGAYKMGKKVTGLMFQIREEGLQLLVTTNDSRIRLLNMDDFSTVCKFKGYANTQTQIGASFSDDGYHVVCGSEDGNMYLWRTDSDLYVPGINPRFTGYRRDRNSSYESFKVCENGMLTCVQLAPKATVEMVRHEGEGGRGIPAGRDQPRKGFIILTASTDGLIKIFESTSIPLLL